MGSRPAGVPVSVSASASRSSVVLRGVPPQVCATRADWVAEILPKLLSADVRKLSGGHARKGPGGGEAEAGGVGPAGGAAQPQGPDVRRNDDRAVDAARARFLARKAQQAATGGGKQGAKR
jgi:ATP-dependent RNA helicase DHX8/PRP22